MTKPKTIILDSSVVAKWFFPEEGSETALEIKNLFTTGKIFIAVPVLLYYEINNILKSAVKTLQINPEEALEVYQAFQKLNLITYSSESLMKKGLEIALEFDISSYDAAYLALAEELQVPFLTADQKLIDKVDTNLISKLEDFNLA